jgi:RNA polymerase sigma-70 factor (ECF subfamily)
MARIGAPAAGRDDQRLIDGLQRGEPDAVAALIDRYGAWIHRVAARLLGDPRDAEEVTQDVLMTIVRKIGTFRGEAAFSSWLYRIAANAAYERLRSRRSRAEVPLEPLLAVFDGDGRHVEPVVDWSARLDNPAAADETRSAIERGIGRLPTAYRAVLLLRDVEGLTNEAAARALGLTVAAVKSRLHRARLLLRQELAHVFAPTR